jgi:RNA polymerase sigma factor (sigma-70 family)
MSSSPFHQMAASSFNTLLEHRNQFLGFVQRRVQDAATAEDILQAAYIRALQHEGELQDRESVVGWFYRVLRNAVIDLYRHRSSESKALKEWGREMEGQSVPSHEIQNEICACLSRVMDTINPAYADALRSVDLGEQRLQDFAEEHNISAFQCRSAHTPRPRRVSQALGSNLWGLRRAQLHRLHLPQAMN